MILLPSTTHPHFDQGYIMPLTVIFMILLSLVLLNLTNLFNHYQRLNSEFKMNSQALLEEPTLKKQALAEAILQNQTHGGSLPNPISQADLQSPQNTYRLRSIVEIAGTPYYIWQTWSIISNPHFPLHPTFEAIIFCKAHSSSCQITHWHRMT